MFKFINMKNKIIGTLVLMLIFGTSCARVHSIDSNKTTLTNNSSSEGISKDKLNDEVPASEQSRLKENRKVEDTVSDKTQAAIPSKNNGHSMNRRTNGIPVLMYHSISYEAKNELKVPKEKFEVQMKYLKDNNYITFNMEEAYEAIINNEIPEKAVVITFDDGYRDNYTSAYPILKKYDLKATIFVISDLVDKSNAYINSSQIREMVMNGIDIESHTVHHEQLDLLSYDKQLKTLRRSKDYLEEMTNKKIISIAYPFGKYNSNTVKAANDAGYELAFTTKYGIARENINKFALPRIRINASDSINGFAYKVKI